MTNPSVKLYESDKWYLSDCFYTNEKKQYGIGLTPKEVARRYSGKTVVLNYADGNRRSNALVNKLGYFLLEHHSFLFNSLQAD